MVKLTPYMITSFLKFPKKKFQQMDYYLHGCLDLVSAQIVATKVLMIIKAYKLPSLFKFKINYCCRNRLKKKLQQ